MAVHDNESDRVAELARQHDAFIEFLPVALVEFTWADYRVTRMNLAARRVTGYAEEDVAAGIAITDLVAPESMELFLREGVALIEERQRTDAPYERRMEHGMFEAMLRRKDGSTYPAEVQGAMVLDGDGRPVGAQIMGHDVSKRKEAERQQQQLVDKLQEANARVRSLEGLLPVCAWCRRVCDDSGHWSDLERYVVDRAGANLSHGICPECAERYVDPGTGGASGR